MRNDTFKEIGPEGQKVIEDVQKPLTEKVMQELNSRVDLDKQDREGRDGLPPRLGIHQVGTRGEGHTDEVGPRRPGRSVARRRRLGAGVLIASERRSRAAAV